LPAAEGPEGFREHFDSLLDGRALRIWQTPPVLRFLGICETASAPFSEACLEKANSGT